MKELLLKIEITDDPTEKLRLYRILRRIINIQMMNLKKQLEKQ